MDDAEGDSVVVAFPQALEQGGVKAGCPRDWTSSTAWRVSRKMVITSAAQDCRRPGRVW